MEDLNDYFELLLGTNRLALGTHYIPFWLNYSLPENFTKLIQTSFSVQIIGTTSEPKPYFSYLPYLPYCSCIRISRFFDRMKNGTFSLRADRPPISSGTKPLFGTSSPFQTVPKTTPLLKKTCDGLQNAESVKTVSPGIRILPLRTCLKF